MTDLARQAAKLIARIEGWHEDSPLEHVIGAIEEVGTLVSHEDAELLREIWPQLERLRRAAKNSTVHLRLETCCEDKDRWGREFTAALQSALDAAGVPDEKGAE